MSVMVDMCVFLVWLVLRWKWGVNSRCFDASLIRRGEIADLVTSLLECFGQRALVDARNENFFSWWEVRR